jgi:hypothetical protein|tara:strand:+ start:391 stop:1182 length:792 start_codon:yes stop_codon:yes gene_type:complete
MTQWTYNRSTTTTFSTSKSTTTTFSTSFNTTWSTLSGGSGGGAGVTTSWNTLVSYTTYWSSAVTFNTSRQTNRTTEEDPKCVLEGTLIHVAEGVQKPVEELIKSGQVLTMDGGFNVDVIEDLQNISTTQISETLSLSSDDTIVAIRKNFVIGIVDINDGMLKTSQQHIHIIKRDNVWKACLGEKLLVGDFLYKLDQGEVLITKVDFDDTNTYTVYKLDVEPNDTFFANGFLTHNKKDAICEPEDYCDRKSICYDERVCGEGLR